MKLRELRRQKNLRVKDLAQLLGCTPQCIYNYEHGYRRLDIITLNKLEQILGASTQEILGYSSESSEFVRRYTIQRANGECELCLQKAPFLDLKGEPFLEIHHIRPLSEGGEDNVFNTVALCPNCHRRIHVLGIKKDLDYIKNKRLTEQYTSKEV